MCLLTPETNALLPLSHRDERSNTPAVKSVPVRITAVRPGAPVSGDPDVAETYPDRPPLTVPTAKTSSPARLG